SQHPFLKVDGAALLNLPLVGKASVGVLEVEVILALRRPPPLDQIPIETRVKPDRGQAVRGQKDRERPLRRRKEEPGEVDDVPRVRKPGAGKSFFVQIPLARLRTALIPFQREPVESGGLQSIARIEKELCGSRTIHRGGLPDRSSGHQPTDGGAARVREETATIPHHASLLPAICGES